MRLPFRATPMTIEEAAVSFRLLVRKENRDAHGDGKQPCRDLWPFDRRRIETIWLLSWRNTFSGWHSPRRIASESMNSQQVASRGR